MLADSDPDNSFGSVGDIVIPPSACRSSQCDQSFNYSNFHIAGGSYTKYSVVCQKYLQYHLQRY